MTKIMESSSLFRPVQFQMATVSFGWIARILFGVFSFSVYSLVSEPRFIQFALLKFGRLAGLEFLDLSATNMAIRAILAIECMISALCVTSLWRIGVSTACCLLTGYSIYLVMLWQLDGTAASCGCGFSAGDNLPWWVGVIRNITLIALCSWTLRLRNSEL